MINFKELHAGLHDLQRTESSETAEQALNAIGRAIEMPLIAWSPDVARPHFDGRMDSFMRRQGWSQEVMSLWWSRHVMLKMPIYLRCRFEHLPFVTFVGDRTHMGSSGPKSIEAEIVAMGFHAMVTTPIRLPMGQIAMMAWLGPQALEEAEAVLDAVRFDLFAAGHQFMYIINRETGRGRFASDGAATITPREWECLRLAALGYHDAEIGRMEGRAATTVRSHLDNVVLKLGATNRVHAIALAAQLGLLGSVDC